MWFVTCTTPAASAHSTPLTVPYAEVFLSVSAVPGSSAPPRVCDPGGWEWGLPHTRQVAFGEKGVGKPRLRTKSVCVCQGMTGWAQLSNQHQVHDWAGSSVMGWAVSPGKVSDSNTPQARKRDAVQEVGRRVAMVMAMMVMMMVRGGW